MIYLAKTAKMAQLEKYKKTSRYIDYYHKVNYVKEGNIRRDRS